MPIRKPPHNVTSYKSLLSSLLKSFVNSEGRRWNYLTISILLLYLPFAAAENDAAELSDLTRQWLELEQHKSKLTTNWTTQKSELERRLDLYRTEQDALQDLISNSKDNKNLLDAKRLALTEEQERLEAEQTIRSEQLKKAVTNIQQLSDRLPPPLQKVWLDKSILLKDDETSNNEKLERVLELYKLAEEFDDRIAVHKTAMEIPSDSGSYRVAVQQIYLGLSQAWYIDESGSHFGYGRSTADGWQWWHGPAASEILGRPLEPAGIIKLKSILQNPTKAEFISLPIKL